MSSPSPDPEADRARERARSLIGRTLDGRYKIDGVIAMGGMGAVYEARHLKLRKRVALKVLHPDVEGDSELVRRFEREALAGGLVVHPHVACATDFGELPDGTRFLVMERVSGETLRDLLKREGPLGSERAARIIRQIAVALGEIHDRGVVHRDLKPRNVMLTPEDFVKVVDFGLAKVDGSRVSTMSDDEAALDARLTAGGVVFGTFGHLAPEAALGMEAVGPRADLYALGVMAYEMLSGKHPFDAATDVELFAKQRRLTAPPLAVRAPGLLVPEALEAVVQRLLERDPEARFGNARELIDAIDAAEPSATEVPPPPVDPPLSSLRPTGRELAAAGPTAGRDEVAPTAPEREAAPPPAPAASPAPGTAAARPAGRGPWPAVGVAAAVLAGAALLLAGRCGAC